MRNRYTQCCDCKVFTRDVCAGPSQKEHNSKPQLMLMTALTQPHTQ